MGTIAITGPSTDLRAGRGRRPPVSSVATWTEPAGDADVVLPPDAGTSAILRADARPNGAGRASAERWPSIGEEPDVWERPRAAGALLALLDVAADRGLPRPGCLAGTGLDVADVVAPGLTVRASNELAAIRNLVAFTKDEPGLGTAAATGFQLGTLGVWGLAMMSSRTVRDLAAIAFRQGYGKFSWGMLAARLEPDGRSLRAVFDERIAPEDVRNFLIERDLAFTVTALDKLLEQHAPIAVETTLGPDRIRGLRELLGPRPLRTDAARNAVWFPAATLDRVLPNGDAYAAAMCERQCEELLERKQWQAPPESARAKVEAVLLRLPPTSWTLENVAAARCVHPRTLNRVLAAEGTSFRAVVDERREALATAMLTETDLTITEIARRIGYAETPSFVRAYRRWTGRTPGVVRRAAEARRDRV